MSGPALRRVLGGTAVAGPVACTIAWAVAAARTPHYHWWRTDLSALAAMDAPMPWITVVGELLLAAGILALAAGLAITLAGRELAVAVGLLTTAALAIAVQALAREDCDTGLAACTARQQDGLVSWHHNLHGSASVLSFMAVLAAPVILVRPFRGDPRWRHLAAYCAATTAAGLTMLVVYVLTPDGWTGLTQRLFVGIPVAWTVVVGAQLVAISCRRFDRRPLTVSRTPGPACR